MNKIRFYYSEPLHIVKETYVVNSEEQVVDLLTLDCIKNLPRFTVCSIYDQTAKTLCFGVARCSPKDNFVKKIGRDISLDRAKTNAIKTLTDVTIDIARVSSLWAKDIIKNYHKYVPNKD